MSEPGPLIRTQDLHRDFLMGHEVVHALDGLSLTVEAGEFLGVMGPSGSGKSTLLYLLGGLDRPTAGHIWVRERDLTALENVEFPMIFARVPPAQRLERACHLLELVGLADRIGHRPTELSGGQQQRVAIPRALVNDPAIILADEPTGNVDSRTGAEVMQVLARLCAEQGRTVVVVTHDPTVTRFAHRYIHLLDGRVTDGQ